MMRPSLGLARRAVRGVRPRMLVRHESMSPWALKTAAPPGGEFSLTKIVATIGPASEQAVPMQECVDAGMRVMRINFSHATEEEVEMRLINLAAASTGSGTNLRAVLMDTQGPEIRTGNLSVGEDAVEGKRLALDRGDVITLTTEEEYRAVGNKEKLFVTYKDLAETVSVGNQVLLDDGAIIMEVTDIVSATEVKCVVTNDGEIGERKGVNLPGLKVNLPALSAKDLIDIKDGVARDMDFCAASFVRKAEDVFAVRDLIAKYQAELWPQAGPENPPMQIISKIENAEAMDNFDAILAASDGIMVARGDLGVEIPFEKVATAQKQMVRKCQLAGKPVIVATQMLESMQKNPRPTRAEVMDVAGAVYDGADCVMLSGESAKGSYYKEAITAMRDIIREANGNPDLHGGVLPLADEHEVEEGMAFAATKAAAGSDADAMIVVSEDGDMARLVAKYRPNVPVLAFVPHAKIARQLQLNRSVRPALLSGVMTAENAVAEAKSHGFVAAGASVVVVTPTSIVFRTIE